MNKVLSVVKEVSKKTFEGQNIGKAIDVAERGVQVVETAAKAVFWLKVTAGLIVVAILAAIGTVVAHLF